MFAIFSSRSFFSFSFFVSIYSFIVILFAFGFVVVIFHVFAVWFLCNGCFIDQTVRTRKFSGVLERSETIETVLKKIERTTSVHFTIQQGIIQVK